MLYTLKYIQQALNMEWNGMRYQMDDPVRAITDKVQTIIRNDAQEAPREQTFEEWRQDGPQDMSKYPRRPPPGHGHMNAAQEAPREQSYEEWKQDGPQDMSKYPRRLPPGHGHGAQIFELNGMRYQMDPQPGHGHKAQNFEWNGMRYQMDETVRGITDQV
jgi:hypothetical protein